jgi:hypothetical protein|tara:strand:+ start:67 stop:591 length:525 start_codon:yes stop_codon:yes gene_type:complete
MFYDVTMNSQKKNYCNKCYRKEYYQRNKVKHIQQTNEYGKTEKGKKILTIGQWKHKGLICDNYDQVYQLWLDSTHCDKCGRDYNGTIKCMDHCHTTGAFRAIVCSKCNNNMLDKSKSKQNTSGHKNISYNKRDKYFIYIKKYYGKKIRKQFKTKVDALCYKYIMLLRIRAGHYN